MAWFKRKRPVNEELKKFELAITAPDAFVILPQPDDEVLLGDWAREAALEHVPILDDIGFSSTEDLDFLVAQLAGWAQVHMDSGPSDWGLAGVVDALAGVDIYVSVRGFEFDGTFTGPEDVADEDLHRTPVIGERTVEVVQLESGAMATHVSSVRRSVFGATEGAVGDEEWYVFLEPEHMVVLVHAEWLSAEAEVDRLNRDIVRSIAETVRSA